jgi:predicted dehydrogenase
MKVLIVGLGSIASKHIHALRIINPSVEIFALRSAQSNQVEGVINVFSWKEIPSDIHFVIISNPSSEHYKTIWKACELRVPLFIEKPALINLEKTDDLFGRIDAFQTITYVAFNFRFHPAIIWLKNNLDISSVLEVQSYCGSYLPSWRPYQDYRQNYSANAELGGGVHLDLTHEIDFITWVFGYPQSWISSLSKVSDLEISSVDSAHYWLHYEKMNAAITLNYFRKNPKRSIEIVTKDTTISVNLLTSTITNANEDILFKSDAPVLETYTDQMKYFIDSIQLNKPPMNSLQESIQTLKICLNNASK